MNMNQTIPFPLTVESNSETQARKELAEAFKLTQEESVANGTDKITMEEIDTEIAAYRREKRKKRMAV